MQTDVDILSVADVDKRVGWNYNQLVVLKVNTPQLGEALKGCLGNAGYLLVYQVNIIKASSQARKRILRQTKETIARKLQARQISAVPEEPMLKVLI